MKRRAAGHLPKFSRRGSAAVAMLLVMVMIGLVIVMMVLGGAGDQDLTTRRLETVRAFYAAEAGINMAMRELALATDEDGDGGIGTIAKDDQTLEPSLYGAKVSVSIEVDGLAATTVLTSRGRSGIAARVAQVLVRYEERNPVGMIAYGKDGVSRPAFRQWDRENGTWGPEGLASDVGDVPYWVVLRGDPWTERFAMGVLSDDQRITVQFWDPEASQWSAPFVATTNASAKNTRVFDLAYERGGGRALLAYRRAGSSNVCYRIWDGNSWSSEQTLNLLPHNVRWIRLVPMPHSDNIVLMASSTHNQAHTRAIIWDGTSFTGQLQLGTPGVHGEHFDTAFESFSGKGMLLYSRGNSVPGFRRLIADSWSGEQLAPAVSGTVAWSRLASNPTANQIVMAVKDTSDRVTANVWDGALWGAPVQMNVFAGSGNLRFFDVAFGRGSPNALLVYSTDSAAPRCRVWDGSSWSAEFDGPTLGGDPFWMVQAVRGVDMEHVYVTWMTDEPDVRTAVWDGSSFSAALDLGRTSAPKDYEPVMAATANDALVPRVFDWKEAEP